MNKLEAGLELILAKFRNEDPQTIKNKAFWQAVKSFIAEEARKLLADGADSRYFPSSKQEKLRFEHSILYLEGRAVDMVRLLLNYQLHPECLQCIFKALCIKRELDELLNLVISRGLPPNEPMLYRPIMDGAYGTSKTHWTPLQMSILLLNHEIVPTQIEHEARILGNEPPLLHLLLRNGQDPKLLRYLLEQGADPNEQCKRLDGMTPLHEAFNLGVNWECIHVLIEHGADINSIDRRGNTPIMILPFLRTDVEKKGRYFQELAKLHFQGKILSKENLEYLRNSGFQELWEENLGDLAKTKALRLTKELTLYDIMCAPVYNANCFDLLKRPEVLEKIYTLLATGDVSQFEVDVFQVAKMIVKNRNIWQSEMNKLRLIFANILPDLTIERIAFFSCVDLFES